MSGIPRCCIRLGEEYDGRWLRWKMVGAAEKDEAIRCMRSPTSLKQLATLIWSWDNIGTPVFLPTALPSSVEQIRHQVPRYLNLRRSLQRSCSRLSCLRMETPLCWCCLTPCAGWPPQLGPAHRGASPRPSPSCHRCHGSLFVIGVADSIVCGAHVVLDAGGEGKRE
jgi:hypothetical protein